MQTPTPAALSLDLAASIAKACAAAGITDPAEIPALITYARTAEAFNARLCDFNRAKAAWTQFSATHDNDDPGHEYHQREVTYANDLLTAARSAHAVALHAWRVARGLEAPAAAAA